jgi:large subunit ribosomal protein L9
MKIILMEDVTTLGRRGDVRDVANGYARNFLLPNLDHLKRQRERTENRAHQEARDAAGRIAALTLTVTTRASEDGRLFGSVSAQDVVEYLERHEVRVEKRRVLLEEPIKALGEYRVPVKLHPEVTAELQVHVVRE